MRLSKQATTPVAPRDTWLAIVFAAVLVSAVGWYTAQAKHSPSISPWLWSGALVWSWGLTAFQVFRFGRRIFSRQWVVFLMGYTLFVGGFLFPHASAVMSWLSNTGMLMVLAGMLAPLVEFDRRQAASAGISDDPANQPR